MTPEENMPDTNGSRSITWRVLALGAASIVIVMASAWAVDVKVSINQIRTQNNEILAQQSAIHSQQAILTSLYNDLSTRVLRLEQLNINRNKP